MCYKRISIITGNHVVSNNIVGLYALLAYEEPLSTGPGMAEKLLAFSYLPSKPKIVRAFHGSLSH